jgi:molybdopterin converting factor subunit 1
MSRLKLLLFASLREAAGARSLELELPAGATVADLKRRLVAERPALARWSESLKVAVDRHYAGDEAVIPDGAEIALIPPVSGG